MCTFDSSRNELRTFEGPDCVKNMIIEMHIKSQECIKEIKKNTEMNLSKKDKFDFENAMACSICEKPFECGEMKCRDHDHRTGEYRGATHQKCNIFFR